MKVECNEQVMGLDWDIRERVMRLGKCNEKQRSEIRQDLRF